jgi:hypothetical protein
MKRAAFLSVVRDADAIEKIAPGEIAARRENKERN